MTFKAPVARLAKAAILACAFASAATAGVLKDGDTVALVGDSITEGRNYTSLIEAYLLACQPKKVRVIQYGWSGEQAIGLLARQSDIFANRPNVITLCYGMNDGRYAPPSDENRAVYKACLQQAVNAFKGTGITVIVGSAGCVDPATFKRPTVSADDYNKTLAALRDDAQSVAKASNVAFADLFTPMTEAMNAGKAKYGPQYSIAGGDGIHPNVNGGLPMAYAFLKALGCDGDVGGIRINLENGTALTTGDHRRIDTGRLFGSDRKTFAFQSTRYPFCFWGNPSEQAATNGLLDAVPFNADLNRFMLYADGPDPKYKVTWGKASKEFTREQLHDGINLAAEFLDNPFVEPFKQLHQAVMRKQAVDTLLFKGVLRNDAALRPVLPDAGAELAAMDAKAIAGGQRYAAEVADAVKPVDHTILFEPVK